MKNVIKIEDSFPLQVVTDSSEAAKAFFGITDEEPRDLGPYSRNPSLRVFGFRRPPFVLQSRGATS